MPPKESKSSLNILNEKRPAAMPALVLSFTKDELRDAGKAAGMRGKIFAYQLGQGPASALIPPLWTIVEEYVGTEESFSWRYIRQALLGNAILKSGESLKECLFSFIQEAEGAAGIKEEKEKEAKAVCAGNAFTLLNIGDVPFSGKIFRRIYARGGDLSGGILHTLRFEDCRLVNFNMTDVYAFDVRMIRTQFENFQCKKSERADEKTAPPSYWRARTNGRVEPLKKKDDSSKEEKEDTSRHDETIASSSYREAYLMCPTNPNDRQLFSIRNSRNQFYAEVVVWDVVSGRWIKGKSHLHGGDIWEPRLTPPLDASDAAMIYHKGNLSTFYYFHQEPQARITFSQSNYHAHYSPQHSLFAGLAHVDSHYVAYIWNITKLTEPAHVLQIDKCPRRVTFSPDGKYLAILFKDKIEMWSVAQGRKAHTFRTSSADTTHIYFSPNGRWIAATNETGNHGTNTRAVYIWQNDPEKYSSIQSQMPFHTFAVEEGCYIGDVAFSPDDHFLAVNAQRLGMLGLGFLHLWEVNSKTLKKTHYANASYSIVWKQVDQALFLVTSGDHGIFCWDVVKNDRGEVSLYLRWTTAARELDVTEIQGNAERIPGIPIPEGTRKRILDPITTSVPIVVEAENSSLVTATPAAMATANPLSTVETPSVENPKPPQKYSRWRIFFFILGAAAIFALCFSPLGPALFGFLPFGAALMSAVTFATTAAGAGWAIFGVSVITGFIVANLDRVLIAAVAFTLNVLKAVFSFCALLFNPLAAFIANYVGHTSLTHSNSLKSVLLAAVGWLCLGVLALPAYITGSLMMGVERLRQSSLYHRAAMKVRNLFGKAEPISRWSVEAPLTYSQAVNGLQTFQNFETCAIRYGCDSTLDAFKENTSLVFKPN